MGVKTCSRKDCNNIMCDTYIDCVGYICFECQHEFKEYLKKHSLNPNTERQIKEELEKFMLISKDDNDEITVNDFFRSFTD